jgi:hypothetical protein
MRRIQRADRDYARAPLKRENKFRNEIEKLRKENRQLRELVARLSKLAVIHITETTEAGEQSTCVET